MGTARQAFLKYGSNLEDPETGRSIFIPKTIKITQKTPKDGLEQIRAIKLVFSLGQDIRVTYFRSLDRGRKDTWNNKDTDLEALSYRRLMVGRLGLHPTISHERDGIFLPWRVTHLIADEYKGMYIPGIRSKAYYRYVDLSY